MSLYKLPLRDEFIKLAEEIASNLTRNIYAMLPAVQQVELDRFREHAAAKKKTAVARRYKMQIGKESRLIPLLIFQIEAFERSLLTLNSLHKTVLCKTMQRSTARDFRIQLDELEAALEQMEDESREPDQDQDASIEVETAMSLIISTEAGQTMEETQ